MRNISFKFSVFFCLSALLFLQNCGQGFRLSETLAIRSQGLMAHISHNAGATGKVNQPIHFEVTGQGLEGATFSWAHDLGTTNFGCDDELMRNDEHYHITCPEVGLLRITLEITKNEESTYTTVELQIDEAPPEPPTGDVVDFRIAAGTGQRDWNSQATAIKVYVGQTLRIFNDDTVNHRMHTNGSPCAHGNDITPGNSVNCVIASAYSSDSAPVGTGPLYDHNYQTANPRPDVWIYAYNGGSLYSTNCSSCHGVLANSTKKGRTFDQIKAAIQNQSQMSALRGTLSDDQIRAIAYSLRN